MVRRVRNNSRVVHVDARLIKAVSRRRRVGRDQLGSSTVPAKDFILIGNGAAAPECRNIDREGYLAGIVDRIGIRVTVIQDAAGGVSASRGVKGEIRVRRDA